MVTSLIYLIDAIFSIFQSEGKAGTKKPEIATVVAPYTATSKEQLSLQRGQMILVRKKTSTGWWQGEIQGVSVFSWILLSSMQ